MTAAQPFEPLILPNDNYNQALVAQVHPLNWKNPTPQACYDLVVIGAGTAGLVIAAGAAGLGLGLKIALIERHLMGGDCLNVGCVPSKSLLRSSRVIADLKKASGYGIGVDEPSVDFAAVMERVRRIRSQISPNDSAHRFQSLGVDVFLGEAKFVDRRSIRVAGEILRFQKAVITTGARAAAPNIPGLETTGYLTNETVFSLTDRPDRLAVVGGGPIGCELAQAFRRFGSEVVLLERGAQVLTREDPDAAEIVQQVFRQEGIQLVLEGEVLRVERTAAGKVITYRSEGREASVTVDEILVGAGRAPNVEELNLEAIGVEYDLQQGIQTNDYLQTTNPKIYAAGDICMNWKFTHAADAAARIVIKNALFTPFGIGRSKLSDLVMPWVTYTDPEVARVGLSTQEAQQQGIAIKTIVIPLEKIDRAITDSETEGFVKIHYQPGTDRILGATIVAKHAGEMISEITTAIVGKVGLSKLSSVIHPYPTQAEGIKKAADAYRRTLLTPRSQTLLGILRCLTR
ncbi:mercuric reductase [Leptolyngbya sp. FACHB-711]|uniref:mercuric reductase n=1 Tax=unclassified Leptolyngbya TaxID=2650499 RepID=UPI001685086B|nr:mercuric reductase [Leptolyngbya sp. FACHB-711]MBD1849402.1 mercuric reductase [Cyanobacteria bacterium FACHB-502]MBD2024130.1 mercuric reductase [Leptolyngbya sp. FACHB-711]